MKTLEIVSITHKTGYYKNTTKPTGIKNKLHREH
jgi:hypothetical protein